MTANFSRAFLEAKVSTLEGFSDDDMEQVICLLMYSKKRGILFKRYEHFCYSGREVCSCD
jgi:hypothetical protein